MGIISPSQYAQEMINKYTRYILNLKYNLETNNPSNEERLRIQQRINDFNAFIYDLNVLV